MKKTIIRPHQLKNARINQIVCVEKFQDLPNACILRFWTWQWHPSLLRPIKEIKKWDLLVKDDEIQDLPEPLRSVIVQLICQGIAL